MQSKFMTTFSQNDAKQFISNSETNEIEKLFSKSVHERAATKCFQSSRLKCLSEVSIKTKNESKQVTSLKYISLMLGEKL